MTQTPKIVKPTQRAVSDLKCPSNHDAVKDHGWLWVTDPGKSCCARDGRIWCRSLATGKEFYWYPSELEEVDNEGG